MYSIIIDNNSPTQAWYFVPNSAEPTWRYRAASWGACSVTCGNGTQRRDALQARAILSHRHGPYSAVDMGHTQS